MNNPPTNLETRLMTRIRWMIAIMIAGLFVAGATGIPLEWEVGLLRQWFASDGQSGILAQWIIKIHDALVGTSQNHPELYYGTDWMAFGHFVIAVAFVGAWRNPVRNVWLFEFGMIACVMVIPFALIFGGLRGIPIWWRLIDCAFGVFGFIPMWLAWRWTRVLEISQQPNDNP